jgi:ABC-type transport system involved in cytochrome bd biosynthesis fused ATPase/permease subunit
MSEHRNPTEELRYQTHLLEGQTRLLDRVRRNSQITAIASMVFMAIVALQCLVLLLWVAGMINVGRMLVEGIR